MIETDLPERMFMRCEREGSSCDGPKEIARLQKIVRVDNSLARQLAESMKTNAKLNEENRQLNAELSKAKDRIAELQAYVTLARKMFNDKR